MIDRETVDRIFAAANIVDVVSDFVTLKKRGTNYMACCPFHNEKTPSFVVSPAKGLFKCFGCGKGGNAVTFVMEHENMTYPEALKYVAKKYGIEVQERELSPEEEHRNDDRESMMVVSSYAAEYFAKALHETPEGQNIGIAYFRERGFSDATMLNALRRMGYQKHEMSVHGFRSIASTLLNELGYNRDWIERQLAHGEQDEVRAAYNYAEYLPERRKMMQDWADYLDGLRNTQHKKSREEA